MRYAFLVGYDGSNYYGFVRQPDRPTVEGEILKSLGSAGVCAEVRQARYRVGSRTDRGVGAVGQVIALDVQKAPNLEEINDVLPPDICILAAREVAPAFDPKSQAVAKHYRYVCEKPASFNIQMAREAAEMLEGEHDFVKFCKREPGRSTVSTVTDIKITEKGYLVLDFIAPAFLRQQVRRMVTAICGVGEGSMSLQDVRDLLERKSKHSVTPARPDGLLLVDIKLRNFLLTPQSTLTKKFVEYLKGREDLRSREMLTVLSG